MWKLAVVALAVAGAIAVGAGVAAAGPSGYRVDRSIVVGAPPGIVQDLLATPQRWTAWSPEEAGVARVERRFGGPRKGAGASYFWSAAPPLGKGHLTVVLSTTDRVEVEREVESPTPSSSDMEFALAPAGSGTQVTWTLAGENGLRDRLLWRLGGRKESLERALEAGLARLRTVAEAEAAIPVHRAERSTVVEAPPEVVMAQVADLHRWAAWSPWMGTGSGTRRTYGGPRSGVGSTYYWRDGGDAGSGRATVTAATADRVEVELQMDAPRAVTTDLEFRVAPEGGATRVTWVMNGDPGIEDAILERGLGRLKTVSEARPARPAER